MMVPFASGRRESFWRFLNAYRDWGWSAEQLAEQFPTVSLAEAHAVLAYYCSRRAEADAYLDEWNAEGDQHRTEWLASPDGQRSQAKLRRTEQESKSTE